MDTSDIRRRMVAVNEDAKESETALVQLYHEMATLMEVARDLHSTLKAMLMAWMSQHGDLQIDTDRRLYIAGVKKTTALSDTAVVERLLELGAVEVLRSGDEGALCSSPWKHGFIKSLFVKHLGAEAGEEVFGKLFRTEAVPEIKEGKPVGVKKEIAVADRRFQR